MSQPQSTTDLITLALARWKSLHGQVTVEDYKAIVAAAREVNQDTPKRRRSTARR